MTVASFQNGQALAIREWSLSEISSLDFKLPTELEAHAPPEARGLSRDQVRLMVSTLHDDRITHTHFSQIPEWLRSGDVLVINTSGTRNAALNAFRHDGTPLELHLSTHLPGDVWAVELRNPHEHGASPFDGAECGESLELPGGAQARLLAPYRSRHKGVTAESTPNRLWLARLQLPDPLEAYLDRFGFPIRYKYVDQNWPLSYYQTVYATERGSAEMPSAGRAFTPEMITRLVAKGVWVAPLLLNTGVASLEEHEPPYEEYYRVSPATAHLVNYARRNGGRVIAVGTTSVRALETVAGDDGKARAGEGWTDLVITPERGLRTVDGLLTGFHEPRSTHLAMLASLASLAGYDHLQRAYTVALSQGYLWHEFGDLHLILP